MIRRITPSGMVTTLAGSPSVEGSTDGIGSKALFYGPVGVAMDSLGNLFVADANNLRITKGIQAFLEFNPSGSSLDSSNNSFRAWLTGPPTCAVIVEASTNLISWLPIQTNSLPAGGLGLSVPLNANPKVFPSHTVKALSCWASFSPKACLG